MKKENFKLQFITNSNDVLSTVASVRAALKGGCRWIQLRMKESPMQEIMQAASLIKPICLKYNATFIIDDHVNLVKEIKADGVHLGQKDMPIQQARQILGNDFIIGGTANTFQDIQRHYDNGADYIGCGPFRFTTTKKNLSPILGIEGYRNIKMLMKESGIDIPMVAIGGIKYSDIPEIISTGVNGIAISGGIINAENPAEETRHIIDLLNENIEHYKADF